MADRTATAAADGGSGGGDGGGKEAPDALTDHGAAAVPKMSPEPAESPGQRRRQAAPAAGSAEPDAAVQGSNMDNCELTKCHKPKGISSRDNNFCNRIDLLRQC